MYRRFRLLAVFALCAAVGCSGCRKPPGAREDSEQGRRLKELYDNRAAIPVQVEGDVPLAFEPITIDHNEKDGKGFYQARLGWEYTGKDRPLVDYLKERVQRNTHELNTSFGRVSAFRLHVAYGTGDPDEVDVPVGGKAGSVALDRFCATDKPTAVTASLHSATWFEDEVVAFCLPQAPGEGRVVNRKLILVAPGDLPIRFDDCPLDGDGTSGLEVRWQLVAEPSALARRVAEMTERNLRAAGREVKSIRLLFTLRDGFRRILREEDRVLDLTHHQGNLALPALRQGETLGSVAIRGVSVTWKERATQVTLTK